MKPDSKEAPPGHKILADWLGRPGTDEGYKFEMPPILPDLSHDEIIGTNVRLNAEKVLEDSDSQYAHMRVDRVFGAPDEVQNLEWKRTEWNPAGEKLRGGGIQEAGLNALHARAQEDAKKIADACNE